MRDYFKQARVALRAYLQRSRAILAMIDIGDLDSVEHLLRLKTAAFHNFRAAETMLKRAGVEVSKDEEFCSLWKEIEQVDQDLATALQLVQEELRSELAKSQRVRFNISKYRSGLQVRSAFERAI